MGGWDSWRSPLCHHPGDPGQIQLWLLRARRWAKVPPLLRASAVCRQWWTLSAVDLFQMTSLWRWTVKTLMKRWSAKAATENVSARRASPPLTWWDECSSWPKHITATWWVPTQKCSHRSSPCSQLLVWSLLQDNPHYQQHTDNFGKVSNPLFNNWSSVLKSMEHSVYPNVAGRVISCAPGSWNL